MSAGIRCWECRRIVPEDELETGRDGRPLCCSCRLKEQGQRLADENRCEHTARPGKESEFLSGTPLAQRDIPSEADQDGWATAY